MSKAYALVILVLATVTAQAEPKPPQPKAQRPWTGYIKVPRVAPLAPAVSSRILYIHRCRPGQCDVHYAPTDDSSTNASSIAAQGSVRSIGEFKQTDEVWDTMMACVRTTFAPFDVTVTDERPPSGTPYFMNMVGGKPADLRADIGNAGGVAPWDCSGIPNAITYTFDVYGPDPEQLCWTVAQELAHAFGLEHEFLQKDPMTYLAGDMPKRFRDEDSKCGEFVVFNSCDCGPLQNSYRHIVGLFGPGAPTPPDLTIKNPVEGKPTQPGFIAAAKALDDVRVEKVELLVDGVMVSQATMPLGTDNFDLPTTDFGAGPHTLEIKATDVQGVVQSKTMAFTQGPPCTRATVCSGDDVCVRGICVAGPDTPGGLGAICSSDVECLSHRCADGGEPLKHCVDECDLGNAQSCPEEFTCLAAGAEGVCWPSPDAGCCDAGAGPQGPILLALGLGVLVLRRRARPSR